MIAVFILLGIFVAISTWLWGFICGSDDGLPDPWLNPDLYKDFYKRNSWECDTHIYSSESMRNKILEMEVCRLRSELSITRYNYECKFGVCRSVCRSECICDRLYEQECIKIIKDLDKKIDNLWQNRKKF